MKKIFSRLIIFFIGIPVLFSLLFFFPQKNYLLFNLLVIVFSALGAVEFRNMLAAKNLVISVPEAVILGALSPLARTAGTSLGIEAQILPPAFILGASWLLISRLFTAREKLDSYINLTVAGFAVMIYPGLFMSWIVQMAGLSRAAEVLAVFFLVVFLNDAAAWLAGVVFGKNNRGVVAASPNKSMAGFAGGFLASALVGIAAALMLPDIFSPSVLPAVPSGFLLGFGSGIAAALGDLGESALKRSVGIKDSGSLIIGRGGVLDSVDSVAMAAPIFYILYQVLF